MHAMHIVGFVDRRALRRRRSILAAALAFTAAAWALTAAGPTAAADYPTRPVTIIVPSTPGGTLDRASRMLEPKLKERLGQPFVVEVRPGAGGMLGAAAVAKAEPDGYTLLMSSSAAHVLVKLLNKNTPYDPIKDFVPLALVAHAPWVLVTNPSLPVKSVQDLIKLAKEKPGSLSYASGGPGNPGHIYAEMLKSMTGIDMVHVPYKGVTAALTDIVGGHVPLMFSDIVPAHSLIAEGKLRALAVSSAQRVPLLPQVPSMAEAGVPGFDAAGWVLMAAPANTPPDIVAKLHGALQEVLALPESKDWIGKNGMSPAASQTPAELQSFVQAELVRWGDVLEKMGIARSQ
jgi:tripartite-type tricarboxylate transporter receptor subunit TctC